MKEVIVIEIRGQYGPTEWGVSFDGSNPQLSKYFKCASRFEADRLKTLVNELLNGEIKRVKE